MILMAKPVKPTKAEEEKKKKSILCQSREKS
jgi:hypothetical protein